ncbi:MAG: hypothetical protein AAB339_07450, partial [Elusimicrobiota bacterium]
MGGFAAAILLTAEAWAIPPYARLFKARYRYAPSCTACHDKDSWDLTAYGKAFFKNGRGFKAFEAAESLDLDGDGTPSGAEIKARSNPGDPRSRPEKPGDWLKEEKPIKAPARKLKAMFPEADSFAVREASLEGESRKRVEKVLGRTLRDEELYPVLFEALKGTRALGSATYAVSDSKEPCLLLAGFRREGKAFEVAGLHALSCPRKLKAGGFLKSFEGKDPSALSVRAPEPGLKAEAEAVGEALRSAAATLAEVFP